MALRPRAEMDLELSHGVAHGNPPSHSRSHSHNHYNSHSHLVARSSPRQADHSHSRSSLERRSESPPPQEMRVLAVDDNNIDRKLIEMLLKTSSFKVTAVKNAIRALEVLGLSRSGDHSPVRKKLEFDLIITDYCMPEMTGYELLRRVKHESSIWKHIPVVIMSSENRPARIARCMAEGAQEFLMKPVKLTDVERLKGYIQHLKETRGDTPSSPTSSSKRKSTASASLPGQGLERRARLSELTVA